MRRNRAIIAFLLCTISGCGTISNMRGETVISMGGPVPTPTKPFGGVIQDASAAFGMPGGIVLIADLPFSLVGDAVTLPWATYEYLRHRRQSEENEVQIEERKGPF